VYFFGCRIPCCKRVRGPAGGTAAGAVGCTAEAPNGAQLAALVGVVAGEGEASLPRTCDGDDVAGLGWSSSTKSSSGADGATRESSEGDTGGSSSGSAPIECSADSALESVLLPHQYNLQRMIGTAWVRRLEQNFHQQLCYPVKHHREEQ
jgi:hypothetical protein